MSVPEYDYLTAGQLLDKLAHLPPDTPILMPDWDGDWMLVDDLKPSEEFLDIEGNPHPPYCLTGEYRVVEVDEEGE